MVTVKTLSVETLCPTVFGRKSWVLLTPYSNRSSWPSEGAAGQQGQDVG